MRVSEVLLTALLSLLTGRVADGKECCSAGTDLVLWNITCSDGANVTLQCPNGFYYLDSSEEPHEFLTDTNGTITLQDEYDPDEFCLSTVPSKVKDAPPRTIALICFLLEPPSAFDWIPIVLMVISIPFLAATLLIYTLVPTLRDLNGKCIVGYVASLSLSYMSIISMHISPIVAPVICALRGAVLYYSTISAFAWLNLVTFNVWRAVRNKTCSMSANHLFYVYLAWSVGLPLLACIIVMLLDQIPGSHFTGNFMLFNCWFSDNFGFWILFYVPMSVLIVLNIAMFAHCSWILWRGYRDPSQTRIRALRIKCMLTVRLFFISGVPWIFEIISFSLEEDRNLSYLWFVIDCINCSQGVITFLTLVVYSQRVLRAIHQRKLCGIRWPESWGELEADSVTVSEVDKVALEQIKQNNP